MSRSKIRKLKRAAARCKDGQAMLALVERSIRFGHGRLALLRCMEAERMGLRIDPEVLRYCQQIADGMSRDELGRVLMRSPVQPAPVSRPKGRCQSVFAGA